MPYRLSILGQLVRPMVATEERVRFVESLSPQEIRWILKSAGIRKGSKFWEDYERAKKAVFGDCWIDPYVYEKHLRVITDYLGL